MDTAQRVHRILAAMAHYQDAGPSDEWLLRLADGPLGKPIGSYRNPGIEGEVIGIFARGLVWNGEGHRLFQIPFAEVSQVTLIDGKESEGLRVCMQDGTQFDLPVKGQRGRFFDSMEMLRFLDRVIRDLRERS